MAEFYSIDPWECDLAELEKTVDDLTNLSDYFESDQLSIKLIINSLYGSLASKYFFMFNVDVAEAITLQGQDLNHFGEDSVNAFISSIPTNKELQKALGIEHHQFLNYPKGCEHGLNTWLCGGDTDSNYVSLNKLVEYFEIPREKQLKWVADLYKKGLEPYLKNAYEEYAKKNNCDFNCQSFELEKIARTCLYYAKKKYSMEIAWEEPGIFLDPMSHVIYKGLEVVQGSTPKFARECQIDFIKFVHKSFYETGKKPPYTQCVNKLKDYRTKMMLQDINDICKGQNIGDYEKFIINDKPNLQDGKMMVGEHCPIHVKAAGYGNFLLFSNKKYLSKYSVLKTGAKCKFYYSTNPRFEVFGFEPGKFPVEYAPNVDYEKQFEKVILDPLNRLIRDVLGYNEVNSNLTFTNALF